VVGWEVGVQCCGVEVRPSGLWEVKQECAKTKFLKTPPTKRVSKKRNKVLESESKSDSEMEQNISFFLFFLGGEYTT